MYLVVVLFALLCSFTAEANLLFYKEGESASLECIAPKGEVQFWFLHGHGHAIEPTSSSQEMIHMSPDGTLEFQSVSKDEHEGSHVCVVKTQEEWKAYSVPMKVKPIPPVDLWDQRYQAMFLQGLVASLVCLVLFVGFCLVQKYRWRRPLLPIQDPKLMSNAFENPTMSSEDPDEINVRM